MEVFLGGSRNLEALPSVCRTPVQQLRPGYVVLAWNADLPVSVDHKLGATVLEGWMREEGNGKKEGKENISKCQQLALHISGSCWGKGGMKETERCQLAIYGSCLSSVLGFSMTWTTWTSTFTCLAPVVGLSLYERPFQDHSVCHFGASFILVS